MARNLVSSKWLFWDELSDGFLSFFLFPLVVSFVHTVPIALIPASLFLISILFLLIIVSGTVVYRRRLADAKGRPYLRMDT